MADYIERAAVEHMLEAAQVVSDADGIYCGYCTEDVRLSEIPAAAVAPVASGEWIPIKDESGGATVWICGACCCGREFKTKERFCPDCGSKMEGYNG